MLNNKHFAIEKLQSPQIIKKGFWIIFSKFRKDIY